MATHKKDRVVIIGDRVRVEIRYGNECGAETIWYACGKYATELPQDATETPQRTIENLKDIPLILR